MTILELTIYLVLRDSETELSHSLREMKGVISYDDFWFFELLKAQSRVSREMTILELTIYLVLRDSGTELSHYLREKMKGVISSYDEQFLVFRTFESTESKVEREEREMKKRSYGELLSLSTANNFL